MDDWKKEFSREELESMGEVEETPAPGPETQETTVDEAKPAEEAKTEPTPEPEQKEEAKPEDEKKPEEAKPEAEPEPEEGKPVPYDRFKKVYGQAKQTERERELYKEKLDLYKRDQTEYYTKYPDEKPADWKAPGKADEAPPTPAPVVRPPVKIIPMRQMLNAVVNDPQTPDYHGRSLRDLLAEGTPESVAAANDYYQTYVESVREEAQKAKNQEAEAYTEIKREAETFLDSRAKELFSKPFDELTKEDQDKVEAVGNETLAWMNKNNLSHYKIADAYKLMRHDELIAKAREQGASALVDHAKKGNVRSVPATANTPPADPYGKYMAMKEDELTEMLMKMPDAKYSEFLQKATPAFRKKFPELPYTV
jgi:hypothetical protein